MLKHHRELQAQKKAEAAKKAEEEVAKALDTETSATTTDAYSQAEPQASTSAGEAPIVGSSSAAEVPTVGSSSAAEVPPILGSAVIIKKQEGEEDADLEEVLSYL